MRRASLRERELGQQRHAGAAAHHLDQRAEARGAEVALLLGARLAAHRERLRAQAVAVVEQQHRLAGEVALAQPAPAARGDGRAGSATWNGSRNSARVARSPSGASSASSSTSSSPRASAADEIGRSAPRAAAGAAPGGGAARAAARAAAGRARRSGSRRAAACRTSGRCSALRRLDEAARLREHARARGAPARRPAGVSSTRRRSRSSRRRSSSASSWRICAERPGLRHAARARRAVEAAEIGDRDQVLELAQRGRLDHENQMIIRSINYKSLEVISARADPLLVATTKEDRHAEDASHRVRRPGRRQPELPDRRRRRPGAAPGPAPDREARALQPRADPRARRARGRLGRLRPLHGHEPRRRRAGRACA